MADNSDKREDAQEQAASENVPQDLLAEIDASVEEAMNEVASEQEEPEVEEPDDTDEQEETTDDDESVEEEDKDEDPPEDKSGDDDPAEISDDLMERAIKAGIPMAEARQYTNASLLETMCDRLEKAASPDTSGSQTDAKQEEEAEDEDPLADIPELDPEEFEGPLAEGYKAMRDLLKKQHEDSKALREEIKTLRGSQSSDWFDSQVEGLGEDVNAAIRDTPEKRESLRTKFDVLTAGYKAAGQDVSRETVFQEAANLVLGDEISQAATDKKTAALGKRKGQHISRTTQRKTKPKGDVLAEVADEVDRKYFS